MSRAPLAVLVAVMAGLLACCSHVPVTSMIKLARVNLAGTDPGELRAAVKVPQAVNPQSMVLRIDVKLADGERQAEDFRLREVAAPEDVLELHRELDPGTRIVAYRLDPAEVARLVAFRDGLKQRQKARGGSGGALALSILPQACRTAALPAGPVYFTAYLRTQETDGYVALARDVDLRTLTPGRDLAAEIPPCA